LNLTPTNYDASSIQLNGKQGWKTLIITKPSASIALCPSKARHPLFSWSQTKIKMYGIMFQGLFLGDHPMHMGQGSLTILDGQFRLRQHCAVVFQFLHPVDLFGWKDAFNAKVLRRQTKSSVT
jgi:hypothetical protein